MTIPIVSAMEPFADPATDIADLSQRALIIAVVEPTGSTAELGRAGVEVLAASIIEVVKGSPSNGDIIQIADSVG